MRTNTEIAQNIRAKMDAELSDPAQADVDLVAAYVDMILDLDGIEPETDDEVRIGSENILRAQPNRRKHRRIRRLLIAAVAAILIVSCGLALSPLGTNDESMLRQWGYFLLQQEPGYRMDFGDHLTIVRGGKAETYRSIRQFVRKTGADILVPTVLPDKTDIREVWFAFDYLYDCPCVHFNTDDPKVFVCVNIGQTYNDLDSWGQTERIGGHVCGVAAADAWYQCDFNDGENGYTVSAHSYADLVSIVENLQSGSEVYGNGK